MTSTSELRITMSSPRPGHVRKYVPWALVTGESRLGRAFAERIAAGGVSGISGIVLVARGAAG